METSVIVLISWTEFLKSVSHRLELQMTGQYGFVKFFKVHDTKLSLSIVWLEMNMFAVL